MSATTETLTEQLAELRKKMQQDLMKGLDVKDISRQIQELTAKLFTAKASLNENKQILKD